MATPETPRATSQTESAAPDWWIFHGTGQPRPLLDLVAELPPPPQWRAYKGGPHLEPPPTADESDEETRRILGPVAGVSTAPHTSPNGATPEGTRHTVLSKINAALYLRRPLLVTGPPGVGKSALADLLARELNLGRVLRWPVTSRATVTNGLYDYDPLAQIHDLNLDSAYHQASGLPDRRYAATPDTETARLRGTAERIGRYLRLGPLGTAFLPYRNPRVLLVDEFDKGDYDLPDGLLDLFEKGSFRIPPLVRLAPAAPRITVGTDDPGREATVVSGRVECSAFPIVILTCNSDRAFPPAFLRRCIPLRLELPSPEELAEIVAAHFSGWLPEHAPSVITAFLERSAEREGLAIDQLLNAVELTSSLVPGAEGPLDQEFLGFLSDLLWHQLREASE